MILAEQISSKIEIWRANPRLWALLEPAKRRLWTANLRPQTEGRIQTEGKM